jgi:hypothetical protein
VTPRFRTSLANGIAFIPPALPRRRDRPPVSDRWIHEVKFDGYRIQHEAVAPNGALILGFFLKPNRFVYGEKFFTEAGERQTRLFTPA